MVLQDFKEYAKKCDKLNVFDKEILFCMTRINFLFDQRVGNQL